MLLLSTLTYAEFCRQYGFEPKESISPDAPVWLDENYYRAVGYFGDKYEGTLDEISNEVIELYESDLTETTWEHLRLMHVAQVQDRYGQWHEYEIDAGYHRVTIDPVEPSCWRSPEHEWRSPYRLLGGIESNPGVWGHGGGVIIREVCAWCGKYRITDTWAQDRTTGIQGLHSVAYEDADDESLKYACEEIDSAFYYEDQVRWLSCDKAEAVFRDEDKFEYAKDLAKRLKEKFGKYWHIEVEEKGDCVMIYFERKRK